MPNARAWAPAAAVHEAVRIGNPPPPWARQFMVSRGYFSREGSNGSTAEAFADPAYSRATSPHIVKGALAWRFSHMLGGWNLINTGGGSTTEYDAVTALPGMAASAADPVVFCDADMISLSRTAASGRTATYRIQGPFAWVTIDIPVASSSPDTINLTVSIGGTNGYTVTRSIVPGGFRNAIPHRFPVPMPWDESRVMNLSWTGGLATETSSPSVGGVRFMPPANAALRLNTTLPSGWTAADQIGSHHGEPRQAFPFRIQTEARRETDGVVWPVKWLASSSVVPFQGAQWQVRTPSRHGRFTNADLLRCGSYDDNAGLAPRPTDTLAPVCGFAAQIGGQLVRAHTIPAMVVSGFVSNYNVPDETGVAGTVNPCWVLAHGLSGFLLRVVSGGAQTITLRIVRRSDWSYGTTYDTVIASYSFSAPASTGDATYFLQNLNLTVGNGLSGFYGFVFTRGSDSANVRIAPEIAKWTPPVPLTDVDGAGIPGGAHPSAISSTHVGTLVAGTYPSLAFAAIPSNAGRLRLVIRDVPVGMYYVQRKSGASVIETVNHLGGMGARASEITPRPILTGEVWIATNTDSTSRVGTFGKSEYAMNFDRWELLPCTITPTALSIGVTNLGTSRTASGYPASLSALSLGDAYGFCSFTAASPGTYTFTVTLGSNKNVRRIVVWGDSGPFATNIVAEESLTDYVISSYFQSFWTSGGTPPTSPNTVTSYARCIVGGTGAWAGRDGQLAYGATTGTAGAAIEWRYIDPPDGSRAQIDGSTWYKRTGTTWTPHTGTVTWSVSMTAGQTVTYRIGGRGAHRQQNSDAPDDGAGFGLPSSFSAAAADAVNVTVAGPS